MRRRRAPIGGSEVPRVGSRHDETARATREKSDVGVPPVRQAGQQRAPGRTRARAEVEPGGQKTFGVCALRRRRRDAPQSARRGGAGRARLHPAVRQAGHARVVRGDQRARCAQASRGAREGDVRGAEDEETRRRNLPRVVYGIARALHRATPSLSAVRPERTQEALLVALRSLETRDESRIGGGGARRRDGRARDESARVPVRGSKSPAQKKRRPFRVASRRAPTHAASRRGRARAGPVAECARRAARARVARRETRLETLQARLRATRV